MVRLRAKLARLAWRMRAVVFARRLSVCLFWALCLATAVVGLDRLIYLGIDAVAVTAILALAAFAVAALLVGVRDKVTLLRAATRADRVLGLGDRLASALQLSRSDGAWAEAVAADARERFREVRAADVFHFAPTLAARLLIPALIVLVLVSLLPPADLLGRMEREVETRLAAQAEAERQQRAVTAAVEQLPGGSDLQSQPTGLGGLRLAFVKIEKELLAGEIDAERRLRLSDRLRRLAGAMQEQVGETELSKAIRKTAEALARGGQDAAAQLRALQEQLDRLERALKESQSMDGHMRELAERKRAAMRTADTSEFARKRETEPRGEPDDDLVELGAIGRKPPEQAAPTGIIYSSGAGRETPAEISADYEAAARSAYAEIDSGVIPPEFARLVRDYFDSIKPVKR